MSRMHQYSEAALPTSLLIHPAGWTVVLPRITCVQCKLFPRQRSLHHTLWHSLIGASHLLPNPNTSPQACPPSFGIFRDHSIWQGALYCPPHRCPLSCKQTRLRRGIHQEQCRGPVPSCILNCGIGINLHNIQQNNNHFIKFPFRPYKKTTTTTTAHWIRKSAPFDFLYLRDSFHRSMNKYCNGSTYVMDDSPIFNGPKFSVIFTDFILWQQKIFSRCLFLTNTIYNLLRQQYYLSATRWQLSIDK